MYLLLYRHRFHVRFDFDSDTDEFEERSGWSIHASEAEAQQAQEMIPHCLESVIFPVDRCRYWKKK